MAMPLLTLSAPWLRPVNGAPAVPDAAADRALRALTAILDELAAAALLSAPERPLRLTYRATAWGAEVTVDPDPGGATLPPSAVERAEAAAERWRRRTALRPEEARVVYGWEGTLFVVRVETRQ